MAPDKASRPDASADVPDGTTWETLPGGSMGDEWDFERDGTLIGHFVGLKTVETQKVESGEATAILIAPLTTPDREVFVWASKELDALTGDLVRVGDLVKIDFLGRDQFTDKDGKPRQIKRYKVQAAARQ